MKTADGKTPMGGADHILNHMKEKYYVPSLLQRAIERFPVASVAMCYVSDKWAGTNNNVMVEFARASLYKSLYRYCKAELGLAS
jgi:hypothetical protein